MYSLILIPYFLTLLYPSTLLFHIITTIYQLLIYPIQSCFLTIQKYLIYHLLYALTSHKTCLPYTNSIILDLVMTIFLYLTPRWILQNYVTCYLNLSNRQYSVQVTPLYNSMDFLSRDLHLKSSSLSLFMPFHAIPLWNTVFT